MKGDRVMSTTPEEATPDEGLPSEPGQVVEPGPEEEQDVPAPDATGDPTDPDPGDAANE
jgi:hypothetical protein